jgi:hypothetical protein
MAWSLIILLRFCGLWDGVGMLPHSKLATSHNGESTGALVVRENPQQRFAFDENSLYVSNNYSIQWHPKDSAPPIERRIAALIQ